MSAHVAYSKGRTTSDSDVDECCVDICDRSCSTPITGATEQDYNPQVFLKIARSDPVEIPV
ncbi:hypothetical protein BIW11_04927 [Tropilaelaps mercedesae]|uniref:Uncharacterized protein n=1 Tax=Tropilaelaps mercedesae TaxID=418985 RepID=A0A1V9X051_9ACAR|nr:hypothetical protein BIW11_04927 [Tropilaelaps mercedesae]